MFSVFLTSNAQSIGMFFDGQYVRNGSVIKEVPRLIELKVKGNTYEVASFEVVVARGKAAIYTQVIDSSSICTFGFLNKFRFGKIPRLSLTINSIKNKQTNNILKLKKVLYVTFPLSPEISFDNKCDFTFNNSIEQTRYYKRFGINVDSLESVQVYREDTTLTEPIKIYHRRSNDLKDSLEYKSISLFEENFLSDMNSNWRGKMRAGDRWVITGFPNCYSTYETGWFKFTIPKEY